MNNISTSSSVGYGAILFARMSPEHFAGIGLVPTITGAITSDCGTGFLIKIILIRLDCEKSKQIIFYKKLTPARL